MRAITPAVESSPSVFSNIFTFFAAVHSRLRVTLFETAAYIFNDVDRIEFFDSEHSDDEDRYYTIGKVGEVMLDFCQICNKNRGGNVLWQPLG